MMTLFLFNSIVLCFVNLHSFSIKTMDYRAEGSLSSINRLYVTATKHQKSQGNIKCLVLSKVLT